MTSPNSHPARQLIHRYVDADPLLDEVSVWTLESHLENCPACRATLAEHMHEAPAVGRVGSSDLDLFEQVALALSGPVRSGPSPVPGTGAPIRPGNWSPALPARECGSFCGGPWSSCHWSSRYRWWSACWVATRRWCG